MNSKRQFLDDVFSEEPEFQRQLLDQTLQYARQRRRRRKVMPTAVLAAALSCAGLFAFWSQPRHEALVQAPAPVAQTAGVRVLPGTHIRLVTDEELLALFAGRPVALVGSGDQRQFVVLDTFRHSQKNGVN